MARSNALSFCFLLALFASSLGPAPAAPMHLRDLTLRGAPHTGLAASAAKTEGVGSSNTITADPPVPRPAVAPCVKRLFTNSTFSQYAAQTFAYTPPAGCPGPFSKIVFNGNFSVSAGIQFDRTASIEIGNVPLFFGTTAEPSPNLSPSWHVESDVTEDAKLLERPQSGEVDIFNIVNSTYTGVISGTAFLQFYPAVKQTAVSVPDLVLPIPNAAGGPAHLPTGQSVLSATYSLPANVESAYLKVYAQSQQTDEQYFLCAPSNVATELVTCPNTAFRETEVSIDGRPAGVAPVYPWIFTGGLDPYLWFPIPGVQTLNFKPYRVELTPFAGILADGKPHTIAFSVDNANNYFQGFATLFVSVDHGSRQVTGKLTRDTLATNPTPIVKTDLSGTATIAGTVRVTSARDYAIDGYVQTSHGRISTSIASSLDFTNYQRYADVTELTEDLAVAQTTTAKTTVTTQTAHGTSVHQSAIAFPISVSLDFAIDAAVTGAQKTKVDQHFTQADADFGPAGFDASFASNEVTSADTLELANGSISGNAGQKSAQSYFAYDTNAGCYAKVLAAANNVLTQDAKATCDAGAAFGALRAMLSGPG
jgi:hypothetical protein